MELDFYIEYDGEREFSILFRIPKWCNGKFEAFINGKRVDNNVNYGFISVCRNWNKDIIHIIFERKIYTEKLPGNENMVAFLDGPEVLAGLTKRRGHFTVIQILLKKWWFPNAIGNGKHGPVTIE